MIGNSMTKATLCFTERAFNHVSRSFNGKHSYHKGQVCVHFYLISKLCFSFLCKLWCVWNSMTDFEL